MTRNFDSVDYTIFALSLCIPAGISIYFGCFGSKQKTVSEYLYGKGQMNAIPIGLSLYSSAVSCIAIIGTTSEVYMFGTQFMAVVLGTLTSLLIKWFLILPVFCGNLKIKFPFQYFELRFDKKVRLLVSAIYVLHMTFYLSIVLYVSTVSFSEATGIPLYICTTIIGAVCVFYTMLGGFKGVIWTDVLQASLMLGSCIFILFKAAHVLGGFEIAFKKAEEGGRIKIFDFNPNPFQRVSFFSAWFGMMIISTGHDACSASGIQRFMAVGSEIKARISTAIQSFGYIIIITISGCIGIFIYALYSECDPVSTNKIQSTSQLLPYFINDITGDFSGFPGLFTAGLLSAGLSSLSAEMNTISGLVYYDFIQKIFKINPNDFKTTVIMKIIIVCFGAISITIAPFFANSKYIYQFALSTSSWTYGLKVGLMLLATTFPQCNSHGAFVGMISGLASVMWVSIGAMSYNVAKKYELPISVSNCTEFYFNSTTVINSTLNTGNSDPVFLLYELSFMYYALFGTIVTILVGLIVSYVTGPNEVSKIDPVLIIPYLRQKVIHMEDLAIIK